MPKRNYEQSAYWTIEVDRHSEVFQQVMDDAKESTMLNNVPKLIVVRLRDYYRLIQAGGLLPPPTKEKELLPPAEQEASTTYLKRGESTDVEANADAALDAW